MWYHLRKRAWVPWLAVLLLSGARTFGQTSVTYLEWTELKRVTDGKTDFSVKLADVTYYGVGGGKIVVLGRKVLKVFDASDGKLLGANGLPVLVTGDLGGPMQYVVVDRKGTMCYFVGIEQQAPNPRGQVHFVFVEYDLIQHKSVIYPIEERLYSSYLRPLALGDEVGVYNGRYVDKLSRESGKFTPVLDNQVPERCAGVFVNELGVVVIREGGAICRVTDARLKPLPRPIQYALGCSPLRPGMAYVTQVDGKPTALGAVSDEYSTRFEAVDLTTGELVWKKVLPAFGSFPYGVTKVFPGPKGKIIMVDASEGKILAYDRKEDHLKEIARLDLERQSRNLVAIVSAEQGQTPGP